MHVCEIKRIIIDLLKKCQIIHFIFKNQKIRTLSSNFEAKIHESCSFLQMNDQKKIQPHNARCRIYRIIVQKIGYEWDLIAHFVECSAAAVWRRFLHRKKAKKAPKKPKTRRLTGVVAKSARHSFWTANHRAHP